MVEVMSLVGQVYDDMYLNLDYTTGTMRALFVVGCM